MEARLFRAAILAASFVSLGAGYPGHRTQNFIVSAPSPQLAQEVGDAAESYRRSLAIEWLGKELPPWRDPCPISVHVGLHLGAGGATSFMFDGNRPFGWSMNIQGSRARLLDSVLPHEITHTVFATHFGRPLPRWADEGACTTVEHTSEKTRQKDFLITFLTTGRGIAFNHMFAMKEYPSDVLPLYAQGYSLARYLIAQGGKRKFVDYVGDGMKSNDWPRATRQHYGFKDLSELQLTWLDWVRQGSPPLAPQQTPPLVAQQDQVPQNGSAPIRLASAATDAAPRGTNSADQLAAANSSSVGGWYARVRDQALAKRDDRPISAPATGRVTSSDRDSSEYRQAVSRPQPVAGPRQIVLEWERAVPNSAPSTPVQASPRALVPIRPPTRVAPAGSGTVWR